MEHYRRKNLIKALHELYLDNLKDVKPDLPYHKVEFLLKSYAQIRSKMTKQYETENRITVTNQLSLF